MANVSHASLTGSNLHEPKGADTAALGTVYVSNGAGGGTWTAIGTSSFTGQVADFLAPFVPTGWLELDGSVISTSTYSALYAVMSATTSGTRTNGSPIITSIPSTAGYKAGYFVFGTGISSGSTILTVDSGTQITISIAATSSGSSAFAISPWLLNTGTIQLPDVTTVGRYRRSRTSTTAVGQVQTDAFTSHTHSLSVTGTTDTAANHTHTATVTDPTHFHGHSPNYQAASGNATAATGGGFTTSTNSPQVNTQAASTGVTVSNSSAGAHSHAVTSTGTSGSSGVTETRPLTLICLTCVKT